jgi:hypothetical protein
MSETAQAPMEDDVVEKPRVTSGVMEKVIMGGDLADLNAAQRAEYYTAVCRSLGLNPLTQPFAFLTLNGKLRLYALRDCADQLRRLHGISIYITNRERMGDIYIVTARAKDRTGREDESTVAVPLGNLKGDALANALMKAETKAKRRVTLSIAGLGWADELEVETITQSDGAGSTQTTPSVAHPDTDELTIDQITDLIALTQKCGIDLATFGRRVREYMHWTEEVKLDKKYLREHLTSGDYATILQSFQEEFDRREHLKQEQALDPEDDVPIHSPPEPPDESSVAEAVGVLDEPSSLHTNNPNEGILPTDEAVSTDITVEHEDPSATIAMEDSFPKVAVDDEDFVTQPGIELLVKRAQQFNAMAKLRQLRAEESRLTISRYRYCWEQIGKK